MMVKKFVTVASLNDWQAGRVCICSLCFLIVFCIQLVSTIISFIEILSLIFF